MTAHDDFRKDWEEASMNLARISQQAMKLARKGQEHLVKLSHKGKLHFDFSALSLKKEKLFYMIGKEYLLMKSPGRRTSKMKHLLDELKKVEEMEGQVKAKLKNPL